jgi:CRP-like cAMP-binding protein
MENWGENGQGRDDQEPGQGPDPWPSQTFLGMLPQDTRRQLLGLGSPRDFLPGAILMLEGEESTSVVVLTSGWVKVTGTTEQGGQALLSLRVGGDLVGEQAALDGGPRSATVISASLTSAYVIGQEDFLRFIDHSQQASVAVSRTLSAQLRWATRRRIDFGGLPVIARLARVLGELGLQYGKRTPQGIEFGYLLSQPDLAAMVGASEPAIHRALRQLRLDGVVTTRYRQVVITDPVRLTAIATRGPSVASAC